MAETRVSDLPRRGFSVVSHRLRMGLKRVWGTPASWSRSPLPRPPPTPSASTSSTTRIRSSPRSHRLSASAPSSIAACACPRNRHRCDLRRARGRDTRQPLRLRHLAARADSDHRPGHRHDPQFRRHLHHPDRRPTVYVVVVPASATTMPFPRTLDALTGSVCAILLALLIPREPERFRGVWLRDMLEEVDAVLRMMKRALVMPM